MMIEIQGVEFTNKGAELMLHAILQQLANWQENFSTAVRPNIGSYHQRANLGLYQLAWTGFTKLPVADSVLDVIAHFIPKKLRDLYGVTLYSEVQAVLDASGFTYSDQWGPKRSELLAQNAKRWQKQGKKVVLLPQAFGPFKDQQVKDAFSEALSHVDLVFARDKMSYEHLIALGKPSQHIKLAPDFTNLVRGVVPDYFNTQVKRPCIVPNKRMLDKTSESVRNSYLPFLVVCLKNLSERGSQPFLLVHENNDYDLAVQINQELKQPVEIIFERNPLHIKGILGCCDCVISSRFHSLVSALSQGVPCLAAGWSHKYQMLLEEYYCLECLISPLSSKEEIFAKIQSIAEPSKQSELKSRLLDASTKQKELTVEMWSNVHQLLKS